MKLVHVYINFPGQTAEAIDFYASVFHTKVVSKMTFGDAAFMQAPEHAKSKIVHAQVPITDAVHLMASDAVEGFGPPYKQGNHFHVSIVANDKAEADRVFAELSAGGSVGMPLANAPWGPYFGMCVDKYGVQWMVSLEGPAS